MSNPKPLRFKPRSNQRHGISLIEVIACTAIVAVMIVPIASVIRASGRAIASSAEMSNEAKLRSGIRWVKDTIGNGAVVNVGSRNLTLLMASGQKGELVLDSNNLIFSDGRTKTVVLENIGRFECEAIMRSEKPTSMIGVAIRIEGKDPSTGTAFKLESLIATAPQSS
ncbi:hypothetical protein [Rubripirellula reticaptiva]|uniref:Prepilin-type N-terminal cleavage/methylation domain-containing protein n=1 Tax=Rubripirellula reticaptiva TaxID=2528013 RepID=A0A5C6F5H6_9BACT|nr:hypothetical protein [Rubripirellula reticaptiva]TWU55800.1 hypothetical protein Poly59_21020 [Rubripirellula reticaptiva]